MEKVDIKSMDITELQELLQELGEPKFRAKQLFDWLHAKQVDSFAEMTNLSKGLREKLGETAAINGVKIVRRLVSQIDEKISFCAFGWRDYRKCIDEI